MDEAEEEEEEVDGVEEEEEVGVCKYVYLFTSLRDRDGLMFLCGHILKDGTEGTRRGLGNPGPIDMRGANVREERRGVR